MVFNGEAIQSRSMLRTFISKFISDELLAEIVNLGLYPADFPHNTNVNAVEYIKDFLNDVNKTAQKLNFNNYKQIRNHLTTVSSILTIRETGTIINYDNVFQHINIQDLSTKKIIQLAITNRIDAINDFRNGVNEVLNIIQAFYEVQSIQSNILKYDILIDSMNTSDMPIFEFLKRYKDTVIDSFNELSKLKTLNKEENKLSNYIILKNKDSSKNLANTLTQYFSHEYNNYKTGFEFIDNSISGFESSSVHIVSAPSNHGKSLLLINLCHNMIENNLDEFKETDAILFVTLEDNIYKLSRRFMSIFGNYTNDTIRDLHINCALFCKEHNNDKAVIQKINLLVNDLTQDTIIKKTENKIHLIIYHGEENTFTAGDLSKFIDLQKAEGINVRAVFLDYIDVMEPTIKSYKSEGDYNAHGQIVHELRMLARRHSVPVITATQNSKGSENATKALTNELIGDSYKKVRYCDFLYMMRMCSEKTFMSEDVKQYVMKKNSQNNNTYTPEILKIKNELQNVLIPVQIVITKSKDGGKGTKTYCLFCSQNLKIYNSIDDYLKDAPLINKNTKKLQQDMDDLFKSNNICGLMSGDSIFGNDTSYGDDIFQELGIFKDCELDSDQPFM